MPWPLLSASPSTSSSPGAGRYERCSLPRCFLCISCLLLTWCPCTAQPAPDAKIPLRTPKPVWDRREQMPNEHCPTFECPAGQRPIQKKESFIEKKMETLDYCPNSDWTETYPIDEDGWGFYQRAMSKCCQIKYLCVQMCGIPWDNCYKAYWNCALSQCTMARDLLIFQRNDSNMQMTGPFCTRIAAGNGMEWLTPTQKKGLGWPPGATCKVFKKIQKENCDCVPKDEWEERLKLRAEDFLRIHAPQKLDKNGRFSNKKMWKAYKGKRHQLMFDMVKTHSKKVVKKLPGPKPLGKLPAPSMQEMLDGKPPDSILKLPRGQDGFPRLPDNHSSKLNLIDNRNGSNSSNSTPKGMLQHMWEWQKRLVEEDRANASEPRPEGGYKHVAPIKRDANGTIIITRKRRAPVLTEAALPPPENTTETTTAASPLEMITETTTAESSSTEL